MAKSKKRGSDALVVNSKVKALLKKAGCNVAGDAMEGLNGVVEWYVHQAAKRAKANGRKTVRPHDFMI